MRQVHPKGKQSVRYRTTGIVIGVIGAALIIGAIAWFVLPRSDATNFKECADAGGAVMETYPEQCTIQGKTFTNEAHSIRNSSEVYIGLTEAAALTKASEAGVAARVIRRDAQDLPVTMDFSPGRLNFYVQDDKVYMVQVEGKE